MIGDGRDWTCGSSHERWPRRDREAEDGPGVCQEVVAGRGGPYPATYKLMVTHS